MCKIWLGRYRSVIVAQCPQFISILPTIIIITDIVMTARNWESDEITLKNELKLIDDSYYRVYDDNDYEIWKERMFSLIVLSSQLSKWFNFF